MAAKTRKDSICVVYEGYWEGYFLEHLTANSSTVHLNPVFCSGGSANRIVIKGLRHSAWGVRVYVLFDEDFQSTPEAAISDETLEGLAGAWMVDKSLIEGRPYRQLQALNNKMRNPILLVSYPQSFDGFLLRLLGKPLQDVEGKTTRQLKSMIAGFLSSITLTDEENEKIRSLRLNKNKVIFMRFLSEKLPLSALAARRVDLPELDILLTAFGL
jgi:hypothetical protein